MRGIDLSHHNGQVGLDIINDQSVELDFVIAKHSEGETIKDTWFDRYIMAADKRGIITGAYHFYVGNKFTKDRLDKITSLMIEAGQLTGHVFLDWEREVDNLNAEFIFYELIPKVQREVDTVGLYASHSVFCTAGLIDDKITIGEYCQSNSIPIWCARYKSKLYRQELYIGMNNVDITKTQPYTSGCKVDINQITSKCKYMGREIDLDYNVAFTYKW